MSIKQKLEENLVYVVLSSMAIAFTAGWGACEAIRVTYKNEKIADLENEVSEQTKLVKDGALAMAPYAKRIDELVAINARLKSDLTNAQATEAEWRKAVESWKTQNVELQRSVKLYASNCSVIQQIRSLEAKKDVAERSLRDAYHYKSEKDKIEDYKRQGMEYQARLVSLQDRLTCIPD